MHVAKLQKIIVNERDMPLSLIQSVLASFLHTEAGRVRGSFHCCGNSISFQMELINLCISERYVGSILLRFAI
jgi:hypothetical protein